MMYQYQLYISSMKMNKTAKQKWQNIRSGKNASLYPYRYQNPNIALIFAFLQLQYRNGKILIMDSNINFCFFMTGK